MTGIGRWNGGGDTPFEDGRSGKPPSGTPEVEAERLGGAKPKGDASWPDKNGQRPREMIVPKGAQSLTSKDASLVAGNVTGGGGKATKKRPNGIRRENVKAKTKVDVGADRRPAPRRASSGYKIGDRRVYMRLSPLTRQASADRGENKNKGVDVSDHNDVLVFYVEPSF